MSQQFPPPPPEPEPERPGTPGPYGAPGYSGAPGQPGYPGAPGQPGGPTYGTLGRPGYGSPGRPGYPGGPRPTSTTGPKVMTFIGIGLIVVSIIALIAGIVQVASAISRFTDEPSASSTALDYVRLPGSVTFTGEDGEKYAVLVTSTSSRLIDLADVVVTAADGRPLALSTSSLNFDNTTNDSQTHVRAVTFTAPEDGVYTARVTGGSADLDGSLTVVDSSELATIFGRTALGVVSIVGSALTGVMGLGLAIGGAIWWNSRSKTQRASAWPPGPGAPPPGYMPPAP